MSTAPPKPPSSTNDPTLDEMLPPVQAPSAGFLLQLFLIPMIIVAIIVLVFLGFHWLAQMSSDPSDLISGLSTANETGWQKAHALSDVLRDPTKDHLKDDVELAKKLIAVLDKQIDESASEKSSNEKQILMRVYLCRALGEFRVAEVLPVLAKAASTERYEAEIDVRDGAVQALALAAKNLSDKFGPEIVQDHDAAMASILKAAGSHGSDSDSDEEVRKKRDELRSAAAYALGVIGGERSFEKLDYMLNDSYPNARFNAAIGFARHGDERAVGVLEEMLDPENDRVVADENSDSERLQKRGLVMMNAMRAIGQLKKKNPSADLGSILTLLDAISDSKLPQSLRLQAKETKLILQEPAG